MRRFIVVAVIVETVSGAPPPGQMALFSVTSHSLLMPLLVFIRRNSRCSVMPFKWRRCKWSSLSVVLMCSAEAAAASVPSWQCAHFVGICLFVFTLFLHAFCLVSTQTLSVSFDPPASPVKSLCVVKKVLCKLSYYYYPVSLILQGLITLIRAVNEGREPYLAH